MMRLKAAAVSALAYGLALAPASYAAAATKPAPNHSTSSLATNELALDRLAAVSNLICKTPGDYGFSVDGRAKIGLDGKVPKLLAKLFSANLSGSLSSGAEVHRGIRQQDLASAMSARNSCAAFVFIHLLDHFTLTDLATGTRVNTPASPVKAYRAREQGGRPAATAIGSVTIGENNGFAGVNAGSLTINNANPAPRDYTEVRLRLTDFMAEEDKLMSFCRSNKPEVPADSEKASNEWFSRVQDYIRQTLDESYNRRLLNQDDLTLYSDGSARDGVCNNMRIIHFQLGKLVDRLQ